mmetsp:Transcript_2319/g.6649  ORF Transcript_2319/g.6649 Transcript_2319/m.6649 type:complete len:322 (-) Transcript_2319:676-1641(-)
MQQHCGAARAHRLQNRGNRAPLLLNDFVDLLHDCLDGGICGAHHPEGVAQGQCLLILLLLGHLDLVDKVIRLLCPQLRARLHEHVPVNHFHVERLHGLQHGVGWHGLVPNTVEDHQDLLRQRFTDGSMLLHPAIDVHEYGQDHVEHNHEHHHYEGEKPEKSCYRMLRSNVCVVPHVSKQHERALLKRQPERRKHEHPMANKEHCSEHKRRMHGQQHYPKVQDIWQALHDRLHDYRKPWLDFQSLEQMHHQQSSICCHVQAEETNETVKVSHFLVQPLHGAVVCIQHRSRHTCDGPVESHSHRSLLDPVQLLQVNQPEDDQH